jgi:hypothetical protein
MNWNLNAARWVVGQLPPEELPDLATEALAAGADSTSLALLAGLSRPTRAEAGPLFEKVLAESGVRVPGFREAVLLLARHVAQQILTGDVGPDAGAKRLVQLAHELDDPPPELSVFLGPESEISDFGDLMRINYYGLDYCVKVQNENRQRVVEGARALVERAGEQ